MKQQPGIGADLSLPISQRGESQGNDSDPETSPKRHRNGTPEHKGRKVPGICQELDRFWGESGVDHLTNA